MTRRALLILTLSLTLSTPALAAEKAGEINQFAGQVQLRKGGGVRGVQVEQPRTEVAIGDAITTKRESEAYVNFIDGNRVILRESSTLEVTGLKQMSVGSGAVLFDIRKQGEVKGFEVKTATVTMGVRGTKFKVEARADGSVRVGLKEGKLDVVSNVGKLKFHKGLAGAAEFAEHQQRLKAEFEASKGQMQEQFEEASRKMAAGDLEYVDRLDLEAGMALMIKDGEVWQSPLDEELDSDFELFKTVAK